MYFVLILLSLLIGMPIWGMQCRTSALRAARITRARTLSTVAPITEASQIRPPSPEGQGSYSGPRFSTSGVAVASFAAGAAGAAWLLTDEPKEWDDTKIKEIRALIHKFPELKKRYLIQLFDAIERGDIVTARNILKCGIDPNNQLGGELALVKAVKKRDFIMIALLRSYGADSNKSDRSRSNAYSIALLLNDTDMLRLLDRQPEPPAAEPTWRQSATAFLNMVIQSGTI